MLRVHDNLFAVEGRYFYLHSGYEPYEIKAAARSRRIDKEFV